jgi:hypothetical protein
LVAVYSERYRVVPARAQVAHTIVGPGRHDRQHSERGHQHAPKYKPFPHSSLPFRLAGEAFRSTGISARFYEGPTRFRSTEERENQIDLNALAAAVSAATWVGPGACRFDASSADTYTADD